MKNHSAQGTIEYLVIIAVVVVISLVVVSMLVGFTNQGENVATASSQISTMTSPIAIVDSESTLDGNIFLGFKNNTGETITITEVLVGDESLPNINQTITQGAPANIVINTTKNCTPGTTITTTITTNYTTSTGLTKTQKLENIQINCSDINLNEGILEQTQGGTPPTGPGIDLQNGLIAHYKMNEDAIDTTVSDSTGNNDGVLVRNFDLISSTNLMATSKINGALSFDGSSDYIDTGAQPIGAGNNPFSISCWFKTTKPDGEEYMWAIGGDFFSADNTYATAGVSYDEDAVGILISGNWFARAYAYGIRDGKYHHFVFTHDGSQGTLWLDDVNVGYGNTSSLNLGTANLLIGKNATWPTWDGSLDDFRVYSTALGPSDIAALYNSGAGTESESGALGTNLVAHYKMNDNAASTTVVDSRGDYNGTSQRDTNILISSKINGSFSFNGIGEYDPDITADYIEAGTPNGDLNITGDKLSVSAWVKRSTEDRYDWIVGKMGSGAGSWWMDIQASHLGNFVDFAIDTDSGPGLGGGTTDIALPNDGTWHHVVGVYDGTNVIVYVDNAASTPIPTTGNIVPREYSTKIGWEDGWDSQTFKGSMDDLRIYNKALSTEEIAAIYNDGNGTEN
ncbi:MAG: LamG domain-containing protein [archaeon]